jgi:methyl-accepting chemotaxis protein
MKIKYKYLLAGVAFGCMFPIGAFLLEKILVGGSITELHMNNKLLFMIDSAPVFLGLFAYVGGLYQEKSVTSNTEQIKLSNELQRTVEELNIQTKELERTSEITITANDDLNETIACLDELIEEVQHDVVQLKQDVNHVSDNSNVVLIKSEDIAEKADSTKNKMVSGEGAIDTIMTQVDAFSDELKSVVLNINLELEKMTTISTNINEVMTLKTSIESISDEIDLLALNASIEAARAGEQGKGFSVVATEIKKLADNSGDSTKSMSEYLKMLDHNYTNLTDSMKDITIRIFNIQNDLSAIQEEMNRFKMLLSKEDDAVVDIHKICASQSKDLFNLNCSIKDSVSLINHINGIIDKSRIFVQEKRS